MFLIGSQAARLTGCLPDWRDGRVQDADLVIRKADQEWLLSMLEPEAVAVRTFKDFPDRYYILTPSRLLMDIQVNDDYADLLDALPDNTGFELFGRPLTAISSLSQLVIKTAYSHLPIHREKNDRDISYWQSLTDLGAALPEHLALADYVRHAATSTLQRIGHGRNPTH